MASQPLRAIRASSSQHRRARDERGSGSGLVAMICLICLGMGAVTMVLTWWVGCAEQARNVADLAALAGAHAKAAGDDACSGATANAVVNGGRVITCDVNESATGEFIVTVSVEVELRPHVQGGPRAVTATARAGAVE